MTDQWLAQSSPSVDKTGEKRQDVATPSTEKVTEEKRQVSTPPKADEWGAESSPLIDLDEDY